MFQEEKEGNSQDSDCRKLVNQSDSDSIYIFSEPNLNFRFANRVPKGRREEEEIYSEHHHEALLLAHKAPTLSSLLPLLLHCRESDRTFRAIWA